MVINLHSQFRSLRIDPAACCIRSSRWSCLCELLHLVVRLLFLIVTTGTRSDKFHKDIKPPTMRRPFVLQMKIMPWPRHTLVYQVCHTSHMHLHHYCSACMTSSETMSWWTSCSQGMRSGPSRSANSAATFSSSSS